MNTEEAIAQFAAAEYDVPEEAMRWCIAHWEEAAPSLLELLERYIDGSDRSEETARALLFVIYLMAEASEHRAFPLLCRLAADYEAIDTVLGDGITTSFNGVLISTFDGDFGKLKGLIENAGIDEFVRSAAFGAMAWLTATGRIDRSEAEAWLAGLPELFRRQEKASWLRTIWVVTVSLLGLEHLTPVVKQLFDEDMIDLTIMDFGMYQQDLKRTLDDPERMAGLKHERIRPVTDAVGELSSWYGFSDQRKEDERREKERASRPLPLFGGAAEPRTNPLKSVGRNDPCPCGSGKKYKKCCLR